uniref:Uncharacterized protein n=1 Tax=Plectus sambesii TaxID=2011161 RepID=A0A914VS09_9BILA
MPHTIETPIIVTITPPSPFELAVVDGRFQYDAHLLGHCEEKNFAVISFHTLSNSHGGAYSTDELFSALP